MALDLPIFELPMALLPGETVPLHIFEDRYKRMIGHCVDSGERFGIVLRDEAGARSVGCTALVTEMLERMDDGRMNVLVTGESAFRVLDRFDDPEDPRAEVELIAEDAPDPDPDPEALGEARSAFARLAEAALGEAPDPGELAGLDSYGLAARVELSAETKQRLLQTRDEEKRLSYLAGVFGELAEAAGRAEEIAERARSNGRIRIGR
ncbi:MAG: LON peptidase substrate-binding domain-containing protein [Solirubrobacterales bacterium]